MKNELTLVPFQVDGVARLACKDRAILAMEQGLGKTLCALVWALLKKSRRVLIVAPGDPNIEAQWKSEAERLGLKLEPIKSLARALEIKRTRPEGYFWIGYETLKSTPPVTLRKGKSDVYVPGKTWESLPGPVYKKPALFEHTHHGATRCPNCHRRFGENRSMCKRCRKDYGFTRACPRCNSYATWNGKACKACRYNRYACRPLPIYKVLADNLFDAIVVDEGVKIKNVDSLQGAAVHALRAPKRLLLSGSPIKNRLPDLFPLLHWCLGNNTPSFPYEFNGHKKFIEDFCPYEARWERRRNRSERRYLPQASNISQLWRLLAPSVLRLTKKDCGQEIAGRKFIRIALPMSRDQQALYLNFGDNFAAWFQEHGQQYRDGALTRAQLNRLVHARLVKLRSVSTLPNSPKLVIGEGDNAVDVRLKDGITTKLVWLAENAVADKRNGIQWVVFTGLQDNASYLRKELSELGLRCDIVNGTNRKDRHSIIERFRKRQLDGLICGIEAMSLGHNLETASKAYLTDFPWTHSTLRQLADRIHRLTSEKDVEIYLLSHQGTIDDFMLDLIQQKADASDLALDGQLLDRMEERVDFVAIAQKLSRPGWREFVSADRSQAALREQLQALKLSAIPPRPREPKDPLPGPSRSPNSDPPVQLALFE